MKLKAREVHIQGASISRGIAIGKPFILVFPETDCPSYSLSCDEEVEREILTFKHAVACSQDELRRLQQQLEGEGAIEGMSIVEALLQVMNDPLIASEVEEEVRRTKKNAESIFMKKIKNLEKRFTELKDPFYRERFRDIKDVARRIRLHLSDNVHHELPPIPKNAIVFARELAISDTATAKSNHVAAFVSEVGGSNSHAAILAKAEGIPYVSNVDFALVEHFKDQEVIVDGRTGSIILSPTDATLKKYRLLKKQLEYHYRSLERVGLLEAETYDGYKIRISANIEMLSEMDLLHKYGGSGVGLFRSEFMFLMKDKVPSEDEQFENYRGLVTKVQGLPFVIRTFDIGGDKFVGSHQIQHETNPLLGCRAIRFLLKERDIFKTHLRAILRASAYGDVRIMFPMISSLWELREAKSLLLEAQDELRNEGVKIAKKIRIGCMIEVPSAAIIADILASECDFLSIGTNDLVQYSLAVDRGSQDVHPCYAPTHPSVIRLIKLVVTQANAYKIPVTICGEIAADPRFTPLLIGLGIQELSVASRYIPFVKNAIRNNSFIAATQLAEKVLQLATTYEIAEVLSAEYQAHVPDDFLFST
jgi:phosphotransferase system enzyme I (PtsI)